MSGSALQSEASLKLGLAAAAIVLLLGPMLARFLRPIPEPDRQVIRSFLRDRPQTLIRLDRLIIGGPPRDYPSRYPFVQQGRPYRVTAEEADGSRWVHVLAVDGVDALGDPSLRERVNGYWTEDPAKAK